MIDSVDGVLTPATLPPREWRITYAAAAALTLVLLAVANRYGYSRDE